MAELMHKSAEETFKRDGTYTTQFLKWKGFIDRLPVLRSIINANADAVTASWRTSGKEAKTMANLLDGFDGNGKETFKLIMNNAIKVAKIGGDYYGEIILGESEDFDEEVPVNLITLPPDNIRQVIKNGRIKRYEELDQGATWKPEEILHLAYNPIGASTHGHSVIETMNNLLLTYEQLLDTGSKIFERYIKPTNVVYMKTDSSTEMQKLIDEWKKVMRIPDSDIFVSMDVVDHIERVSVPAGSTLDPAHWYKVLLDNLLMSSRVSENILGIGTQNSEESARMQYMGFLQMVRMEQKFLEENLRRQLFIQAFPEDTPDIKFSFASETQDENYNRMLSSFQVISGSAIDEGLKILLQTKLLLEMGLIEDV